MRRGAHDWRVTHRGRGSLDYEELRDGQWQRLTVSGEMGVERPYFVINFGSRSDWASQPAWARGRRDEILTRIKCACPIPDYGYEGEAVLDASDATLLIELAGGQAAEECLWAGCHERALLGKRLCVTHSYPAEAWS